MVMPRQQLMETIVGAKSPIIVPSHESHPIVAKDVQIASLDFRLGLKAYAMSTAALPHGETVTELIKKFKKYEFELGTNKLNLLEKNRTYLIPLLEECRLPDDMSIHFSPKSSTGRVDVFVRVVCDNHSHYDRTPEGYRGPLYLEVTPLSFDVRVKTGLQLVQGRFKTRKTRFMEDDDLARLHAREGILFGKDGKAIEHRDLRINNGRMYFHIDLDREIVGFVAEPTVVDSIDLGRTEYYEAEKYWRPIRRSAEGFLILKPGLFYLLATKERVRIPAECCGEILAFDITTGEFRPHYAGFFDNGFGGDGGTNGVLEVRDNTLEFRLVDGQPICAMVFEKTFEVPDQLYAGNYKGTGPSLSKHFMDRYSVWSS